MTQEHEIFDILCRDLFSTGTKYIRPTKSQYPVNVYRLNTDLIFEVPCPGIPKKDVRISVEKNTLKISHRKNPTASGMTVSEQPEYYFRNALVGSEFELAFSISNSWNLSELKAKSEDGLLRITIPLAKEAEAKSITIE